MDSGIFKQEVLSILRNDNKKHLDVYKTKIKKDLSIGKYWYVPGQLEFLCSIR